MLLFLSILVLNSYFKNNLFETKSKYLKYFNYLKQVFKT